MKQECVKCSSDDILIRYVKKGDIINTSSSKNLNNKYIISKEFDFFYQLSAKIEHLRKHCRCCQYYWREDTSDNKDVKI